MAAPRVRSPRRRSYTVVRDWAELAADVATHTPARLLLADADPAVAGWGADVNALFQGFARIETPLLELLSPDALLVWATNSTRIEGGLGAPPHCTPGGNRLLIGARKPRLSVLRRELGRTLEFHPVVVVGDQWLIDGLLAWRLGARFVLWKDARPSPWWAKLQFAAGLVLVRPLYRRSSASPRTDLPAPGFADKQLDQNSDDAARMRAVVLWCLAGCGIAARRRRGPLVHIRRRAPRIAGDQR